MPNSCAQLHCSNLQRYMKKH